MKTLTLEQNEQKAQKQAIIDLRKEVKVILVDKQKSTKYLNNKIFSNA